MSATIKTTISQMQAGLPRSVALTARFARHNSNVTFQSTHLGVRAPALARAVGLRPHWEHLRSFGSTALARTAQSSRYATGELTPSPLGQGVYDHISERDMETLYECLEELCENHGASGWEVEYSAGVLNLSLPPHGTYVLNKQPPNQQIWMSSPISGPCRFGFVASGEEQSDSLGEEPEGTWCHFRKEGVNLGTVLEGEIRALCEQSAVGEGWAGIRLP